MRLSSAQLFASDAQECSGPGGALASPYQQVCLSSKESPWMISSQRIAQITPVSTNRLGFTGFWALVVLGLLLGLLNACSVPSHPKQLVVVIDPVPVAAKAGDCARYGPKATVVRVRSQRSRPVGGDFAFTALVAGIQQRNPASMLELGDTLMNEPLDDLNDDNVTDTLLYRLVRTGDYEWNLDCGNWGECVVGAYLQCAPNRYVEMIPAD